MKNYTFPTTVEALASRTDFAGPFPAPRVDGHAIVHRFGDVSAMLSYAVAHAGAQALEISMAPWHGASFDAALTLARDGWPQAAKEADSLASGHLRTVSVRSMTPVPRLDVCGESVDVGAFLSGEPEAFLAFEKRETAGAGRVVTLTYNGSTSGGVPTQVMVARGAATLALARLLEEAGYSTEIVYAQAGKHRNATVVSTATVKQPDQPFDAERLAFWFCHPAALRRITFAIFDGWGVDAGCHYPAAAPPELRGDIYVSHALLGSQWADPKSARAWIVARLKEQGVEVTEAA
jgi:hypothetical protein